jgi:flagellar motor switch protein FliM
LIHKEACTSDLKQKGQKIDCEEQAFLLRRIPILKSINDCLIKNIQNRVSTLTKTTCFFSDKKISLSRLHDYFKQVSCQHFVYAINVNPVKSKIFVFLEKNMVHHIIDLSFGGTGNTVVNPDTSLFSVADLVFRNLLSSGFEYLTCSFKDRIFIHFYLEENKLNALDIKNYSEETMMLVCPFHLSIKQNFVGQLTFLWPYELLISAQDLNIDFLEPPVKKETAQNFKIKLFKSLSAVNVEVKSRIINQAITLSELLNWKIGDVIPLDFSQKACLMVESIPIFSVKLGNANNKYALKILDKV